MRLLVDLLRAVSNVRMGQATRQGRRARKAVCLTPKACTRILPQRTLRAHLVMGGNTKRRRGRQSAPCVPRGRTAQPVPTGARHAGRGATQPRRAMRCAARVQRGGTRISPGNSRASCASQERAAMQGLQGRLISVASFAHLDSLARRQGRRAGGAMSVYCRIWMARSANNAYCLWHWRINYNVLCYIYSSRTEPR